MRTSTARCLVALALAGAAHAGAFAQPAAAAGLAPPALEDILRQTPASPEKAGIPAVRFNAIRETALTYGAQAGLSRRTHENLQKLDRQAQQLDEVYNFQALMVEGNVVPPVLSETTDVYDQVSDDMLRVIGKVFRIEQPARFTYVPPTWRAYLMMGFDFDRDLVAAVTPQTSEEKALWEAGVRDGWRLGMEQADSVLKENWARLQRDFIGMVKYHQMLEAGMVSKPFVASTNKAVVRAEDGSMHVGEVFLRITASPDFVMDTNQWSGGPRGAAAARLRSAADPQLAERMLKEARDAGIVKERGR